MNKSKKIGKKDSLEIKIWSYPNDYFAYNVLTPNTFLYMYNMFLYHFCYKVLVCVKHSVDILA